METSNNGLKGKTYEERFGKEKAELIKQKMRDNHRGMSGRKHKKETIEKIRLGNSNPPEWLRKIHSESKMGNKNPMYGKDVSEKTKKKKREANLINGNKPPRMTGVNHPMYGIRGKNNPIWGKNNPNWKGGITPENDKIRKTIEYRLWRKACMIRDNFTDRITGEKGGRLVVHHINNFADFPELRTALENGITLSEKTHKAFHKEYGCKNNTKEQLDDFLKKIIKWS
jgi:hypothetical protein